MKAKADLMNPFPGLRSFRSDEDYVFFGREEQTLELVTRLQRNRFIAVVGTSGRGKSSLVRCGLLSRLQGGGMVEAGAHWEIAVMHPGGDPLRHLAAALLEAGLHDREAENALPHLLATLGRSQFGLIEAVRQAALPIRQAQGGPAKANFLLVVDQFEEVFRYDEAGETESEVANDFIAMLREASAQTEVPIYIVTTLRSDFIGDCSRFEGLAEAVNRGEYLIPGLNRDQFKAAIEGPIRVAGGQIAPRLLQRLLNDLGEEQDQLPCLQHALMRTWRVWQGRADAAALDLEDYAQVGKMSQALSVHADEVFSGLATDCQRELCAAMFKALTVEGSEKRGIRRPRRLQTLCGTLGVEPAELMPVIDAFRHPEVSFLTPASDVELRDTTVIDLSHESLMRVWTRLRDWVDDEAKSVGIFRRLSESAALWRQGKSGFYRDPELSIASSWVESNRPNAVWAEQYDGNFEAAMAFLQASSDAAQEEIRAQEAARQRELDQARALAEAERERAEAQTRFAGRLKWLVRGLGLVAMVAVAAMFVAFASRRVAQENAELARQSEIKAQAAGAMVDNARGQAEKLVAFLLDDFFEDLATTAAVETVRSLAEQAIAYYDGLPAQLRSTETKRNRAFASLRLGIALRTQGSLAAGNDMIDQATMELERLYAVDHRTEIIMGLAEGLLAQGTGLLARGSNPRSVETRQAALSRASELVRPLASSSSASPRVKLQLGRVLVNGVFMEDPARTEWPREAREILATIGARDLSNLNAASFYATATNNLAVMLRQGNDAESRLAERGVLLKEAADLHAKILARRPADLNSARGYGIVLSNLSYDSGARFAYADELQLRIRSNEALAYAMRLDPANQRTWEDYVNSLLSLATAYHNRGRISEQQAKLNSVVEILRERRLQGSIISAQLSAQLGSAVYTAGIGGDLKLAQQLDVETQELRRISQGERRRADIEQQAAELSAGWIARNLKVLAADYEAAIPDCEAVVRSADELLRQPGLTTQLVGGIKRTRSNALGQVAICQVMLGRFAAVESTLSYLRSEGAIGDSGVSGNEDGFSQLSNQWLGLALAKQDKRAEALRVIAPLLNRLRERRAKGEDTMQLSEWFARALMVEAIAQPDSSAGRVRRAAGLQEAVEVINALTPEAQQTFFVKQVRQMIDEELAKLSAKGQ